MRLHLDDPHLDDIRHLLQTGYTSLLPSEDTLAQAWSDPVLHSLLTGEAPEIGRILVENAIQTARLSFGKVSIQSGIPVELLASFTASIAEAAMTHDAERWAQIAQQSAISVIDTALDIAGEVPVVGWVTKIMFGVVKLAQALAPQGKPRPYMLRYTKETDELIADQAIKILGSNTPSFHPPDWTPIFLPPYGDYFDIGAYSDNAFWGKIEGETGARGGLGCIPPGMFGSRVIQVSPAVEGLKKFGKGDSMKQWYRTHVNDAFVQLPGLARIAQAVWTSASTNFTPTIYNIIYNEVRGAWTYYSDVALAEANAWIKSGKAAGPKKKGPQGYNVTWYQGEAIKYGIEHANFVDGVQMKTGKADGGPHTAGFIAEQWCKFYNTRAFDMLRTQVCAYASQRQAWFQNAPGYRDELEDARKLLLQHPKVKSINPNDCPDRDFEQALRSRGAGTAPPLKPGEMIQLGNKIPQRTPPPPGFGLVGHSGGGGGGLVLGAAALAAVVGAAWWMRK